MSVPRILVVRSGERPVSKWGKLAGVEVVERESHRVEAAAIRRDALRTPFDLAVFTSQIGVDRMLNAGEISDQFRRALQSARVAAVGPSTAGALRSRGIEPALVGASSAESVLAELPESLSGWRVLLPCGEDASQELPTELERRGARVDRLVLYRKMVNPQDRDLGREILEHPFALFCATSPAAARWLFDSAGDEGIRRLRDTPAVVLGPSTRRFLEEKGVREIHAARPGTYEGAAEALARLAVAPSSA